MNFSSNSKVIIGHRILMYLYQGITVRNEVPDITIPTSISWNQANSIAFDKITNRILVHKQDFMPNEAEVDKEYDVFISHASEDRNEVIRPLAHALINEGLKVWHDEFELKIGDSLRRKIDKGLANSKFGIVVLSKDLIKKRWTNYELDGIITKAVSGELYISVNEEIIHAFLVSVLFSFSISIAFVF